MFGSRLDIERLFAQHGSMGRTRVRRRRLLALIVTPLAAGLLSGPVAAAMGTGVEAGGSGSRTYVVRPGDTLWSIATRFAPARDPRPVVDAIRSTNGVDPAALVPGQRLSIPSVG
jgi:Tfp pilus assembly protein FimV